MRPNIVRAFIGGFLGVLAMTLLLYYPGSALGIRVDIAGGVAHLLGARWRMGMVAHFVVGTLCFPLIYSYVMFRLLPGRPVVKGIEWGLVLWILMELIFMPITGAGIFNSLSSGIRTVIGACLLNLIYGALQGWIAGPAVETGLLVEIPEKRAA